MGIQSQADRRLKKSKPSYQRTNSQTFKMFDEAQVKEFKEIFNMIDKNGDAILEASDLVALYSEDLGKPADEAALGAMIAEAPGPLDFQMLLQLFGEKMSGTDPEETIMAGWALFDPTASGEMAVDAVKALLCNRGVKADRLTEAEVAQMFDQVKPAGGKFNYGKFTRIINKDLGRIIAETTPSPTKKNTVCHKQVEPGSPEPAPAHLRFFIYIL